MHVKYQITAAAFSIFMFLFAFLYACFIVLLLKRTSQMSSFYIFSNNNQRTFCQQSINVDHRKGSNTPKEPSFWFSAAPAVPLQLPGPFLRLAGSSHWAFSYFFFS